MRDFGCLTVIAFIFFTFKANASAKHFGNTYNLPDSTAITDALNAQYFFSQSQIDSAIHYAKLASDTFEKYGISDSLIAAENYFILSDISYKKARSKDTQLYAQKGIDLLDSERNQRLLAKLFTLVAVVYIDNREDVKALSYLEQALNYCEEVNCESMGKIYNNIGNVYFGSITLSNDADERRIKANEAYEKALQSLDPTSSEDIIHIAKVYFNQGALQQIFFEYKNASILYKRALHIFDSLNIYSSVANTYQSLGLIYEGQGSYDSAMYYYEKSLNTYKKNLGEKNRRVSLAYMNLAIVKQITDSLEQSLLYFQKALSANLDKDFESQHLLELPSTIDFVSPFLALNIMTYRMDCLWQLYNRNEEKDILLHIDQSSEFALRILSLLNKTSGFQNRRSRFLDRFHELYQTAAKSNVKLFETSGNTEFLVKAFELSERSKSQLLISELDDGLIKNSLESNDSLLFELRRLEREADEVNIELRRQKTKDNNKTIIDSLEEKALESAVNLDKIITEVNNKYPKYTQRKKEKVLDFGAIQDRIDEKTILLEYFVLDTSLLIFRVDPYQIIGKQISMDSTLTAQISEFNNLFRSSEVVNLKNFGFKYQNLGNILFKELILPLVRDEDFTEIDRLVIIPDGTLSYLPFELLLLDTADNYKDLHYLLRETDILYSYSSRLLFNDFNKDEPKKRLIAFAPSYSEVLSDSAYISQLGKFRDELVPLKWNQPEVMDITTNTNGDAFIAKMATKNVFLEKAPDYQVLHLAMHALIDDEDPLNSRLAFSNNTELEEGSFLHAYEIYSLDLKADMAVLSACNTALGKFQLGEGVNSISRAFSYAGVPSTLTTQWRVNDQATYSIMNSFYQYLDQGKRKSEALRLAKLDYLAQASPIKSNPYYWGSFIIIGKDDPIDFEPRFSNRFWVLIGLFSLGVFLVFIFLRLRSK